MAVIRRFAFWLLRTFGTGCRMPKMYALIEDGQRVAEVTTNMNRVRAEAQAMRLNGRHVKIVRLGALEQIG